MTVLGGSFDPQRVAQELHNQFSETDVRKRTMNMVASRALEHKMDRIVPNMFEDLVGHSRPELLEISCEPESVLADFFIARTRRHDAPHRCALLDGHDIPKREGLGVVVEQILSLKPKHVWIALSGKAEVAV